MKKWFRHTERLEEQWEEYQNDDWDSETEPYEAETESYEEEIEEYEEAEPYEAEAEEYEEAAEPYEAEVEPCEEAAYYEEAEPYREEVERCEAETEMHEEAAEPYEEAAYYEEAEPYREEVEQYEAETELHEEAAELYEEETEPCEEAAYYEEAESYREEVERYEAETELHEEVAEPYEAEVEPCEEAAYYEEAEPYREEVEQYEAETELHEEAAELYEAEVEPCEEAVYYEEAAQYGGEIEQYEAETEPYREEAEQYKAETEQSLLAQEKRGRNRSSRKSFWQKLQQGVSNMGVMDRVILGTGVGVLVLALVAGSLFYNSLQMDKQLAEFASVGNQLEGIGLIGENGLVAVADAESARVAAANALLQQEQEAAKEYTEAEYGRNITVAMGLTSVQKDLKIKFTNQSNQKLISNVPFSVEVTDADGKTSVWSDDDMDGIIYKTNLTPGNYSVLMETLTDTRYADYTISTASQKVEVKKEITYKKIDVSNEIKKESEVNVAKEDTKQNVTTVESSLTDTVGWVESKTVESTYYEISKSSVANPQETWNRSQTVSGNDAQTTSGMTLNTAQVSVPAALSTTVTADVTGTQTTVTAVSQDTSVATAAVSGNTITITGAAAGTTTVTVSCQVGENTVSQEVQVTVLNSLKDDKTTKLTDTSQNQLYVSQNGSYREAVYADYYTADKFFVGGSAKYTGWQTLDGKIYYFNAEGQKVTGEQVIQGAKYTFDSSGVLTTSPGTLGIDVSKWNGTIDWNAVKNSGVSYVIIRCGYRGSAQGSLIEDSNFKTNIKGATAAGLKVGVYFFTQAISEVEALEEASMVLEQIKGYQIAYPIFLDVEPSGGRADSISKETRTAVCKTFCETIRNAGYTAGIYANKTWLTSKLNVSSLSAYKIWLAQYAATPTYTGKYDLWQYKSTGTVGGIKGKVDLNLSYLGY